MGRSVAAKTKRCEMAGRVDGRMNIRGDVQDARRDTGYTICGIWRGELMVRTSYYRRYDSGILGGY